MSQGPATCCRPLVAGFPLHTSSPNHLISGGTRHEPNVDQISRNPGWLVTGFLCRMIKVTPSILAYLYTDIQYTLIYIYILYILSGRIFISTNQLSVPCSGGWGNLSASHVASFQILLEGHILKQDNKARY